MAKHLSDVQRAALDYLIEYKKANFSFIDDIVGAIEDVGHIAEIAHAIVDVAQKVAEATPDVAETAAAVAEAGGAALAREKAGLASGGGKSLALLIAARHQLR